MKVLNIHERKIEASEEQVLIHIVTIRYIREKQRLISDATIIPKYQKFNFLTRREAMKSNQGHEISASDAVVYMKLRLSAEQMPSINTQNQASAGIDRTIEHMRSRLIPLSQPQFEDNLSPAFNQPEIQNKHHSCWCWRKSIN
jgi:hypothetical protein